MGKKFEELRVTTAEAFELDKEYKMVLIELARFLASDEMSDPEEGILERAKKSKSFDSELQRELLGLIGSRYADLLMMTEFPFTLSVAMSSLLMEQGSSIFYPMAASQALPVPMGQTAGDDWFENDYMPIIQSGEGVAAYAQTEASYGSNAAGIKTKAVLGDDGEWRLTGEKIFCTSAPLAPEFTKFFVVLAVTDPDAEKAYQQKSLFVVEADEEGVIISSEEPKDYISQSPTGSVAFADARARLLGERGAGWNIAMLVFELSRVLVAAQSRGVIRGAQALTCKYVEDREIWDVKLKDVDYVRMWLERIDAYVMLVESLIDVAAAVLEKYEDNDKYHRFGLGTARAKLVAGRLGVMAVDSAMQVQGGFGVFKDSGLSELLGMAICAERYEGDPAVMSNIGAGNLFARIFNPDSGMGLTRLEWALHQGNVPVKTGSGMKNVPVGKVPYAQKVARKAIARRLSKDWAIDWFEEKLADVVAATDNEGLSDALERIYEARRRLILLMLDADPCYGMDKDKYKAFMSPPNAPREWHRIAFVDGLLEGATAALRRICHDGADAQSVYTLNGAIDIVFNEIDGAKREAKRPQK